MPAFFAHDRGSVVRVASQRGGPGGALPFRILMQGVQLNATSINAIITSASINEKGNYQFLHTVSETIYAYVFGDRIGELTVSGLCFANPCDGGDSGMQQVLEAYRTNRIAVRAAPVQVSFGTTIYRSFLVGMSLNVANPELQLGEWSFRFNTFPRESI